MDEMFARFDYLKQVFKEFSDLGEFQVPEDYDHDTSLEKFRAEFGHLFMFYSDIVNDQTFSQNATSRLVPGQRFNIKVFKHQNPRASFSINEDRLAFLAMKEATLLGANGLPFLFKHKRRKLTRGFSYFSIDWDYALPSTSDQSFLVTPFIRFYSSGRFDLSYVKFNTKHLDNDLFIGFFEIRN